MISFTGSDSVGGGVVAGIFHVQKSIAFLGSGTFLGHRQVTRRLLTLTQIQAHFPGLLTHSNHLTTSIHSRKKHFTKVWGGGPWPPWPPPGYATDFGKCNEVSQPVAYILCFDWNGNGSALRRAKRSHL